MKRTQRELWQNYLRDRCDASVSKETVHGTVLRWSKESLVLAGFDQAPTTDQLGIPLDDERTQKHIDACEPPPSKIPAAEFANTYRKPLRCLNDLRSSVGLAKLAKNAPELDDAETSKPRSSPKRRPSRKRK